MLLTDATMLLPQTLQTHSTRPLEAAARANGINVKSQHAAALLTSSALKQMNQYRSLSVSGYMPARTPAPYICLIVSLATGRSPENLARPLQAVSHACGSQMVSPHTSCISLLFLTKAGCIVT
jgi:hypothetical protein